MATPTFIYAFDNLGHNKFAELCNLLLMSHYPGFMLGGVGADGGIDAEIDPNIRFCHSQSQIDLLDEIIQPNKRVIFQFKHKTVIRIGEGKARSDLKSEYKCRTKTKLCELHKPGVVNTKPDMYILITNVEVNSRFRAEFIAQCQRENPNISHYQIIGLDELETWVTLNKELGYQFFPAIFDKPRFNLKVDVQGQIEAQENKPLLEVNISNVGHDPSYIASVNFRVIVGNEEKFIDLNTLDIKNYRLRETIHSLKSPIQPGQTASFYYDPFSLRGIKIGVAVVTPIEIVVFDQLNNRYNGIIPEYILKTL